MKPEIPDDVPTRPDLHASAGAPRGEREIMQQLTDVLVALKSHGWTVRRFDAPGGFHIVFRRRGQ
jgi:hypothetical protein